MLKREREITHPMTNARDRTDHITLVKDIMIRQGIRQIPNTANNHHHQQLPTPERLHIPHTQQQAEQRDERQEVDLRHPLSPPRPRGVAAQMMAPCLRLVVIVSVVALENVNIPLKGISEVVESKAASADWRRREEMKVPVRVMRELAVAAAAGGSASGLVEYDEVGTDRDPEALLGSA